MTAAVAPRVLLLAAGHGRRAGGPKAWRDHEGRPMLEAQLAFLRTFTPPERISISIQEGWLERCRELAPDVRWVPVDPDATPLASVLALLRAGRVERSFVYHVDMPVFSPDVFAALAACKGDAVPSFNGRRGHPALISVPTLLDVLRLDPEKDRLDEFLLRRGIDEVPVDCETILRNLNGPAETAA